jgi:hypothetical protein
MIEMYPILHLKARGCSQISLANLRKEQGIFLTDLGSSLKLSSLVYLRYGVILVEAAPISGK